MTPYIPKKHTREIRPDVPAPPSLVTMHARNEAINNAQLWLADPNCVIADFEVSGVSYEDEMVQAAVINMQGETLLDTFVRPRKRSITPEAEAKHGITMAMLKGAPKMEKLYPELKRLLDGKTVIAHDSDMNERILRQSLQKVKLDPLSIQIAWRCMMWCNANFVGEWDGYFGHYKWHKLTLDKRSALGDCRLVLKLLTDMAATPEQTEPGPEPLSAFSHKPVAMPANPFGLGIWPKVVYFLVACAAFVAVASAVKKTEPVARVTRPASGCSSAISFGPRSGVASGSSSPPSNCSQVRATPKLLKPANCD
jgi:DNA polymerase-3 subunit epsilon